MATSGTYTFTLDLGEILEEAFERAGLEMRSGYDYRTGRRSADLLLLEWQNRGINLWTIQSDTIDLVDGTARYQLDDNALDAVEVIVRTGSGVTQTDTSIERISISRFVSLVSKNSEGQPHSYYLERTPSGVFLNLWPVPNDDDNDLVVYYMSRIQDVGSVASNNADLPARFLPALIAGLAYYISMKRPESSARAPLLKAVYEEQLNLAEEAHREKAAWRLVPAKVY